MYIATKADVYSIDRECEENYNISTEILMENAGKNAFLWVKDHLDDFHKKKFLVFCSHGNNGGDGAVFARYLFKNGIYVTVVFLGDVIGRSKNVARKNFMVLKELGVSIIEWDLKSLNVLEEISREIKNSDVIVDAIFGIGFEGEVSLPYEKLFEAINSSGKLVISLDIPSGVLADGGKFDCAIKADFTLTFGFPKYGMLDYPGAEYCGRIEVIEIGIPEDLKKGKNLMRLLTDEFIKSILIPRKRDTHKGSYGHLLIIGGYGGNFQAGIKAMSGSVVLAGLSALKAGVGLLTIAADERILLAVQSQLPEAMTLGWNNKASSVRRIINFINKNLIRSVLIGNGFYKGSFQKRILEEIIVHPLINKIVIDADGLNILSDDRKIFYKLSTSGKEVILTPHIGEAARLLGINTSDVKNRKLEAIKKLVKLTSATVILKDSVSLIMSKNENLYVNNRGSVALAKGGSGDVLAGLVAGFFTSNYSAIESGCLASYALGVAGEICELESGSFSTLSREVINKIDRVFLNLKN